ncbi:MAG: helix-turn-helix domain-containing protein, partial [Gemmataceae bacterium]
FERRSVMPWKVKPMSQIRAAFVDAVLNDHRPVAAACRHYGISRKTGYKLVRRRRQSCSKSLF